VHFISIFAIFLAVAVCSAASLIGTEGLGMTPHPQNAAVVRNGFAPINPAINVFENKTVFGTAILYEHATAQDGNNSISLNSFTVPSISMVLPLGFLGTFGIGLEQKYFANNRLELLEPTLDANILFTSRVGIYELTPSYSIRLPYLLSDFAIGASYRIFFGNSYQVLERGKSDNWGSDAWMAKNVYITKKEEASFESSDNWWRNFGGSLHLHRKTVDYFFSYFPSVQMEKNIKENIQFNNTDTLGAAKKTEPFKLSKIFGTGVHFRFWQNQNLSLVYEHQNPAVSYFAEYKITGTGFFYSPFFKRNNFGVNAWYAEKYLEDVNEYGGSLLSDFWLGRRGTLIGFAFFGGWRQAKEPYWDEPFLGFKLSLTGVGNWGTSYRRK
jgi:long-chain fatty acid transport protein